MKTPDVELTDAESGLLNQISFDATSLSSPKLYQANGNAVCDLVRSLVRRDAIPAQRMKWFIDPEYNVGGNGRSRSQVFVRNGTAGEAIFRHAHFLPDLRYLIYGPICPTQ